MFDLSNNKAILGCFVPSEVIITHSVALHALLKDMACLVLLLVLVIVN